MSHQRFTELAGELTRTWTPTPTGVFEASRALEIVKEMDQVLRDAIADEILTLVSDYGSDTTARLAIYKAAMTARGRDDR